ncbi:Protein KRI1 [Thelohanellus kitauei]|uniref:Protein KRI1 homolog n=1 Tax=Thelohanellus kitauei TaxID=669202 RepID=A0A0C2J6B9_THEKT|nr:Protein KRI1 [Thelohanellus kitauei]
MFTDDQNEDFSYVESFDCDIPKNSKRKQKKLMRLEKSKKKYMEKHGQIVNHSDPIDETCEYEDVIDDLPVRYNYRKVAPNSYGLTPEQILLCDDKELNKWCSIKKVIGYNDEEEEQKMENIYKRRIKHPQLRKRILPSLFSNTCDLYDTSSQNKKSKRSPRKTPISTNRIRLIKKYFNQADLNKVEKLSTDRLLAYNLKNDSKYSLLRKSSKKKDIS